MTPEGGTISCMNPVIASTDFVAHDIAPGKITGELDRDASMRLQVGYRDGET